MNFRLALRVAGVGNVCTHPARARGAGYFQLLMAHCVDEMRRQARRRARLHLAI